METKGQSIIRLQTGDPDFPTHSSIVHAAERALHAGETHYSHSQGLPLLRELLANAISNEIGTAISSESVCVTHGAVHAVLCVLSALIEPGDDVLIFEPNWPTVDSLVSLLGGRPVKVKLQGDCIAIMHSLQTALTKNTKMICLNTPVNPTGEIISGPVLNKICSWAQENGLYVVADEVYRYLHYSESFPSSVHFLKKHEKYIFVDSFSKKFAMTGWRIGYCVASRDVIKKVSKASQLTITNLAPFVQHGAIEALTNGDSLAYAAKMRAEYDLRRKAIGAEIESYGLVAVEPSGAFFYFIRLPRGVNDVDFCGSLLNEYKVACVPGSAFGRSGCGHVRISYANSLNEVLEGVRRIACAVATTV